MLLQRSRPYSNKDGFAKGSKVKRHRKTERRGDVIRRGRSYTPPQAVEKKSRWRGAQFRMLEKRELEPGRTDGRIPSNVRPSSQGCGMARGGGPWDGRG